MTDQRMIQILWYLINLADEYGVHWDEYFDDEYEQYREDFEKGAKAGLYKYVESNVYGDRKQNLPIVKEITQANVETKSFQYNNTADSNAYYLTMNINYTKDLGYPTTVELVLIHNNDRLEVAKLETKA